MDVSCIPATSLFCNFYCQAQTSISLVQYECYSKNHLKHFQRYPWFTCACFSPKESHCSLTNKKRLTIFFKCNSKRKTTPYLKPNCRNAMEMYHLSRVESVLHSSEVRSTVNQTFTLCTLLYKRGVITAKKH